MGRGAGRLWAYVGVYHTGIDVASNTNSDQFAICISSGGLAALLDGPFPYRAQWLEVIASILFVVEIVTYVVFSAIMTARWIIYPHVAVRRAMNDPDELLAYAIPPIALMTIAALTGIQASNASWGDHAFTLLAYVLWWIGCAGCSQLLW